MTEARDGVPGREPEEDGDDAVSLRGHQRNVTEASDRGENRERADERDDAVGLRGNQHDVTEARDRGENRERADEPDDAVGLRGNQQDATEASDRGVDREPAEERHDTVGLRGNQRNQTGAAQPPDVPEAAGGAEWQRLDPRMLLVHPVREVIRFLPVLVGLFVAGTASGGRTWQYVGVLVPIAVGVLRYLTTRYRFAHGRVELRRGLLNRHVLSSPLDRVRTVDVTASLIHRVLGLATVRIGTGTASTDADERLDLDGLPAARARGLRAELLHVAPAADVAGVEAQPQAEDRVVLRFDPTWARFAPLTSSGAVIAAGLFGGGAQLLSELGAFSDVDATDWSLGIPVWVAVVGAAIGLLVGVAVLSVAGYLVTNWNFRLSHAPGSWHLSRGLLTTRDTSIDDERLAGVTIGEPLGLRMAGAARLSAIVTGLGSEGTSSALAPPAPQAVVIDTAGRVLGTDAPGTCALNEHGPAAARRRFIRAVGPAFAVLVAAAVVVLVTDWSWSLLAVPVLLVPAAVALAVDRTRSLGHALVDGYVVARSGSLIRRREALEVDHVIGWTFRSTWFQRRQGLTTLVATTAGGRQAVTVLDVPEERAVGVARLALPELTSSFERPG